MRTTALLSLLLALGLFGSTRAGADEQEVLRQKLEAKLAEPWLSAQDWTNDYDLARQRSAESGKLIFAYFTRSYAP